MYVCVSGSLNGAGQDGQARMGPPTVYVVCMYVCVSGSLNGAGQDGQPRMGTAHCVCSLYVCLCVGQSERRRSGRPAGDRPLDVVCMTV